MFDFDATCHRCGLRFRSHYIWVIHMDEHDKDDRIKELESKLEEARAFQNEWHNPADLLQINQLQSRLDGYEKWFSENSGVLASHRIGGFHFGDASSSDPQTVTTVQTEGVVERQKSEAEEIVGDSMRRFMPPSE